MTEPPDDDELREFLNSEFFEEMSDDMLLDEVGRGEDHRTIYDNMSDEEWELQDHLADIKEQTEDEPIPKLISTDDAMKIIAEAKKKFDERTKDILEKHGGDPVAISDDAQQVAQLANDETASQAMEGAVRALADAVGSLNAASNHLSTAAENLQAAGDSAASQASQAGNLLGGEDGQSISGQGQALAGAISDQLSKIANIDIAGELSNLQGVDLAELAGRIQQLRDAIKSAAQKHI